MSYLFLAAIPVLISGFLFFRYVQRRKGLRILMYHHIGRAGGDSQSGYFVSDDVFARQLELLSAGEYNPVALSDVENAFLNKTGLPERAVLLTFDDGYRNNYEYAYPLAVAHKIPITVFLSVGEIGRKEEMLTWEQVREMADSGFVEFASHGVNHKRLRELTDEEVSGELVDSRKVMEGVPGGSVHSFCYPFGAFDRRVRNLVFKAGYKLDFGTRKGLNRWPLNRWRPLKREHIVHGQDLNDFKRLLHD